MTDRRRPDSAHQHGGRQVLVPRARTRVLPGVDVTRSPHQAQRQAQLGGGRHVELRGVVVGAGH